MPDIVVIINPISGPPRRGRGAERVELAQRTLERLRLDGDVLVTQRGGHAHELALEAVARGARLVMAWGGDGTLNEVGRALVQVGEAGTPGTAKPSATWPALGLIPGGSGNGLSRQLGIPFDPARAIEHAIRSKARQIDVGELGDHLFFNIAGIGLDAHVAALLSTRVRHRGLLPYVKASLSDLISYRPLDYRIEADGRTIEMPALLVALANSKQYGFGAQIAPQANITDGVLDLVAVASRGLVGNLVRAPSLFTGRVDTCPGVTSLQVRTATIRARSPMLFHVDGEAVQGSDTLHVRVHPRALLLRG
jgi:diacylglycerol kinase (ATP)